MRKILRFTKLGIFIVFAVLVAIFNHHLLHYLRYLVPSLLMLYGLDSVLTSIVKEKKECYKDLWFSYGIGEMMIGITLISSTDDFAIICVVWGVWSIVREMIEIHEILSGEVKGIPAVISGIESIVAITFSIMLIITPGEHHAHTHLYLLIAELLVTGLIPVLEAIFPHKKEEKND